MEVSSRGTERMGFEQVFVEHAPFAWRVLRRFGVAESDLPDACQDAFIVVHRKLHDFEGRSHLRTWLYRICARVASDYRKRAHRRYETEPLTREPAVVGDQHRTAELTVLCGLLERTLDGLDDDKRQVFVLYELEDLPMTQVAELLGCPLKTAFSRLYVARDRVNAALRRAGCAALIVALDPFPMRGLAQPSLVSALDATGAVSPNAAQLSTQLGLLNATASKIATSSTSALPALLSTGALAAAAVVTLTFATPATPSTRTAPVTSMPEAAALATHTALPVDEPRVDLAVPLASGAAVPAPVPSPSQARAPRRASAVAKQNTTTRAAALSSATAQSHTHGASASAQWIEAPSVALPNPVAAATVPGTGLDEVLSATSIRGLMRVGPSHANDSTDTQWALLPDSAKTNPR